MRSVTGPGWRDRSRFTEEWSSSSLRIHDDRLRNFRLLTLPLATGRRLGHVHLELLPDAYLRVVMAGPDGDPVAEVLGHPV